MVGGNVEGERRHSWGARALSMMSVVALVLTMSLATVPAASAASAHHGLAASYYASKARAAPGVRVWHQPRLTKLVRKARAMTTMHIPYSSGGHGPRPAPIGQSVDCSGLVRQLYHYAFGVDIGRGTGDSMVRTSGKFARTRHPVPGDVILIGNGGRAPAYHMMIYVGQKNGHPLAVASPTWGETVEYQHPWTSYWAGQVMGYWHFKGADRLDSARSMRFPRMTVKMLSARSGHGALKVTGFAFDPMNRSRSVTVDVYANGHRVARVRANKPSPGANNKHHLTGKHRLEVRIPIRVGKYAVRLRAHNIAFDRVKDGWTKRHHVRVRK